MQNIIVTGVPRSRTSLTMQILKKLDIPMEYDEKVDEFNENGYFETDYTTDGIDTRFCKDGYAYKIILWSLIDRSNINNKDKIIFCLRNPYEIAASMMISGYGSNRFKSNLEHIYKNYKYFKEWVIGRNFFIFNTDNLNLKPKEELLRLGKYLEIEIPENKLEEIYDIIQLKPCFELYTEILNLE